MDIQNLGMKSLEEVCIKSYKPMIFGARNLEKGEPILYFENIQIGQLSEENRPIIARGGWGNNSLVVWDTRDQMTFRFQNGIINQLGLGLLLGANVLARENGIIAHFYEKEIILDENGEAELQHAPLTTSPIFVFHYALSSIQEKITEYTIENNRISCGSALAFQQIACDYYFTYNSEAITYTLGKQRFNGNFSLEAMFYMKDENDGLQHTALLSLPKIQIVSNIKLYLGEKANPTVSTFDIIAFPDRTEYGESIVAQIVYLDDDIQQIT